MLCSRLVKFVEQLEKCDKPVVNLLAMLSRDDRRTTLGTNIAKIKSELNGAQLSYSNVRGNAVYFPIPSGEEWRVNYLKELLDVISKKKQIENFSVDEARLMVNALCTT